MAVPTPVSASQAFPLDAERADHLAALVRGLDAPGLLWISGYAAGLAAGNVPAARPAADADAPWTATIVYGSQTGNGRRIAEALGERLLARGLRVRVLRTGEYPLRELAVISRRIGTRLIAEGFFNDAADIETFAEDLNTLDRDPENKRLAWRHGISKNVLDKTLRTAEVANWIEYQVLPMRVKRGRG